MVMTPDETRNIGYIMLMWISGCSWCGGTFNLVIPRIREIMRGRNYVSPNDFMTDRYNNKIVTAMGALCSSFQQLMICCIEFGALKFVILSISGDEAIAQALSWFLGMFVFTCECMGGMSSVALTDAIQLTPFMLTS